MMNCPQCGNPINVCRDCGLDYDDFGLDFTLPHSQWNDICPEGDLLCANCIVQRASKLPGVIAIRAVIEISRSE